MLCRAAPGQEPATQELKSNLMSQILLAVCMMHVYIHIYILYTHTSAHIYIYTHHMYVLIHFTHWPFVECFWPTRTHEPNSLGSKGEFPTIRSPNMVWTPAVGLFQQKGRQPYLKVWSAQPWGFCVVATVCRHHVSTTSRYLIYSSCHVSLER